MRTNPLPTALVRRIDCQSIRRDKNKMIRRFFMLLLIGAILGLFAQEVAIASARTTQSPDHFSAAATAMSQDCAETMGLTKPQPDQPCQGLTLDCIAKMGCAASFTLTSLLTPALAFGNRPELLRPMPVARLVGRNTTPEPEPPALPG